MPAAVVRLGLLVGLLASGPAHGGDSAKISTSAGTPGGTVVLWPRVIPASSSAMTRAAAFQVQSALASLATQHGGQRALDVRPEPQRVCRRAGCVAASVGAVLVHASQGCAVVATVSGPGPAPAALVPWAGDVRAQVASVPFREPPESFLTVKDFVPCDQLVPALDAGAPAVVAALQAAWAQ